MYDYIIIGGGSAGCVLANRLSENGKWQVCLLEAGPPDTNPLIRVPLGIIAVLRSNQLNWKYKTVPQKHCANRTLFWPRGRVLGGSSAINAMVYTRGNPEDYNIWSQMGNTGWSYAEVLPFFKKLENFEPGANEYHHMGGPLNIAKLRNVNPLVKIFIQAGLQTGYLSNNDFTSNIQCGIGEYLVMQKDGQRCSNAHAYLNSAKQRKNLNIITHAQVSKILFKEKHATGVIYEKNRKNTEIHAKKEIILSAGTIVSPQILLLSGVGPLAELEKHKINVTYDLPGVGENLQDHLDIYITCLEKTRLSLSLHPTWLGRGLKNLFYYILKGEGELTCNAAEAGGFFTINKKDPIPQFQWHFLPSVETHHAQDLRMMFKYYGYTLKTALLHPFSKGKITLQNTNIKTQPLINPNYLSDERDLELLLAGIKQSLLVLSQPAFSPHCLREFAPGEAIKTDEQICDYIRQHAETIYHPVGTCKMGIDAMSVVTPELKVHGIHGLRVVDASIMPTIISGNTNVPVTMIAEKAADMILSDI